MIGRAFIFIITSKQRISGTSAGASSWTAMTAIFSGQPTILIHSRYARDLVAWYKYASVGVGADVDYWAQEGTPCFYARHNEIWEP